MNNAETLMAVIEQLRNLFLKKSKLKGFDDWNVFLGCINAIELVANGLSEEKVDGVLEEVTEE